MSYLYSLVLGLVLFSPFASLAQSRTSLVPLSNTLGCLFRQNSSQVVKTRLVKLAPQNKEIFVGYMDFNKVLVRKRQSRRNLRSLRGYSQNRNDKREVRKLTRRIANISSVITGVRECRRGITTIGLPPGEDLDVCNIVGDTSEVSSRIINGSKCGTQNSPIVRIDIYNDNVISSFQGSCSGTVVGPRTVITAAHCLPKSITRAEIVYGIGGQITSTQLSANSSYDGFQADFDIGVVRTEEDIPTRRISVLDVNDLVVAEVVLVAGYGYIDSQGSGKNEIGPSSGVTDGLQAGFMRLDLFTEGAIQANYIFRKGGSNTCNGDSGGPILVERHGEWLLAGVVSNGRNLNCGRRDTSGFSNITSPNVKQFLKENIPDL